MPRINETKVYQFDELTDDAKERARQWYRDCTSEDFNDFHGDCVIDDAKECFKLLGIRVDRVFYSGFWSQGDGACFEGAFYASDFQPGKLEEHAPKDEELHRIAKQFQELVSQLPHSSFQVKHHGHYSHSHCTEFDIDLGLDEDEDVLPVTFDEEDIKELARDCMDWIYSQLQKEFEYQNADEQVDESIRANEYEFTEDGRRS